MPKIIVSYRRADTGPIAGRIFDRLGTHYGFESCFMDIDNIPFGVDFREHIQEELSQCDVLVVIIGPQWMGVGEGGKTRLSDETDPVRIEVETAMRARLPIIPILVNNASMPKATELPDSLRDFAFRNAAEVDAAGRDFRQHMDRVVQAIDRILERKAKQAPAKAAVLPVPERAAQPEPAPPPREPEPVVKAAPPIVPPPVPKTSPSPEPVVAPVAESPAGSAPPRLMTSSGAGLNRNALLGIGAVLLIGGGLVLTFATNSGNDSGNTPPPKEMPAPPPKETPPPPATDYPARPVRVIVPFSPGGTSDVLARLVGDYLSRSSGQQVIIENRPGAGGTIGIDAVVKATPDGYTLGVIGTTDIINRYLYATLAYDPLRDLVPAGMIGRIPPVIVVLPSAPDKSLRDFIARARANPGRLTYSTAGKGTASHLSGGQMALAAGINLQSVQSNGYAPALVELLGGRTNIMHALPLVRSEVQGGKLRALAIVGRERWPEVFPDVPSTAEAGLPDNDLDMWAGIAVPRGTPRPIVEKLNVLLRQMIADPATRARLTSAYLRPVSITTDEFAAMINRDAPRLEKLVKDLNISPN